VMVSRHFLMQLIAQQQFSESLHHNGLKS
jgi:hypothetical protein